MYIMVLSKYIFLLISSVPPQNDCSSNTVRNTVSLHGAQFRRSPLSALHCDLTHTSGTTDMPDHGKYFYYELLAGHTIISRAQDHQTDKIQRQKPVNSSW